MESQQEFDIHNKDFGVGQFTNSSFVFLYLLVR